jgi:hypothetical protein
MNTTVRLMRALLGTLAAALTLAACVGVRGFVPAPAEGPVTDAGQRLGFSSDSIARGHDVYAARCQRCHSLEPPQDRTVKEWEHILPRMARKARIDEAEMGDVRAYILAAREAATSTPDGTGGTPVPPASH